MVSHFKSTESIKVFAAQILSATTVEQKLSMNLIEAASTPVETAFLLNSFPSRPKAWSKLGKSDFPKMNQLKHASERAKVIHFFANHELLALELMAHAILKFEDANESLLRGLAQTICEEQSHMQLYLHRMNELGLEFGEFPLSDYFWKAISQSKTEIEFFSQMSLTLEQANLDFCLYYEQQMLIAKDQDTARLLRAVYNDEIGHVKHGLKWVRHLKDPKLSDWQAYEKNLPPPMSVRRAKGIGFGSAETIAARVASGFDEHFIAELKTASGSKGRPPRIFAYDALVEARALGSAEVHPLFEKLLPIEKDFEIIPHVLCIEGDAVLVTEEPGLEFKQHLVDSGLATTEWWVWPHIKVGENELHPHITSIEPWGWSKDMVHVFQKYQTREVNFSFKTLFSKAWAQEHFSNRPSQTLTHIDEVKALKFPCVLKAPFGTAGSLNRFYLGIDDVNRDEELFIKERLAEQQSLLIEPLDRRVIDFSIQGEITVKNGKPSFKIHDPRRMQVSPRGRYLGAKLFGNFSMPTDLPAEKNAVRFLFENGAAEIKACRSVAMNVAQKLFESNYQGPFGIDCYVAENNDGTFFTRPVVEVNPRYTMGRIALELEKVVAPSSVATLEMMRSKDAKVAWVNRTASEHAVVKNDQGLITSGLVFLTEPMRSKKRVACLRVKTI